MSGDVGVEVTVRNDGAEPVEIPFASMRQRGPAVHLVGPGGQRAQLRTPPVRQDLLGVMKVLSPGESASFPWPIHEAELASVGGPRRVEATFALFGELRVRGEARKFQVRETLVIALAP